MQWLIAGLGNPGSQYHFTRHNIGFMALDFFAESLSIKSWTTQEKALTAKAQVGGTSALLVKPQTFMNRSGESVQPLLAYYKIPLENLIVVHDEVEFPFGSLRLHKNKSAAGNNGIKSIAERLGTHDFIRLRLGVGKPSQPGMELAAHVLGRFSDEEQKQLPDFLNTVGDALECLVKEGLNKAASWYNK